MRVRVNFAVWGTAGRLSSRLEKGDRSVQPGQEIKALEKLHEKFQTLHTIPAPSLPLRTSRVYPRRVL